MNGSAFRLARLLATWFGCGYAPVAPGTAGSAAALAIAFLLARFAGWQPWHFAVLAAAFVPAAIWAGTQVERAAGKKDPGLVVIDEVLGQWLTLAGAASLGWKTWLAAFLLFRALDIWKPLPARHAQRLAGGLGIVADDLIAGAYGALVLSAAGCFNR